MVSTVDAAVMYFRPCWYNRYVTAAAIVHPIGHANHTLNAEWNSAEQSTAIPARRPKSRKILKTTYHISLAPLKRESHMTLNDAAK